MSLRARTLLAHGAAVAALAAVFWLYTRPEIGVALADQLWACFN
ncbi:MAG TPA: hypothetical protein VLI46_04695 [Ramlibacter sp.]|nr:hypothetical protein [Ramlibacter sp.]